MKQKVAVIFHSVSGNTFTMAKQYQESLLREGFDSVLNRVRDGTIDEMAKKTHAPPEIVAEIKKIPTAVSTDVEKYDAIFMGTPTYFGNVSSQMKRYWEGMYNLWSKAVIAGTYFGAFSTVATTAGGAEFSLMALLISALHMGMIPISVPATIDYGNVPAYGLTYHSTPHEEKLPGAELLKAIDDYITYCAPIIRSSPKNKSRL